MLAVDTGIIKRAVSSKRWRDDVSQISGWKCTLWLWALPQTYRWLYRHAVQFLCLYGLVCGK